MSQPFTFLPKDITPAELALLATTLWAARGPACMMNSPMDYFEDAFALWLAARAHLESKDVGTP